MTSTITVLTKARALIRKGWTQGWFARAKSGRKVDLGSKRAVCWCIGGAIEAIGAGKWPIYSTAIRAVELVVGDSVTQWNDRPERKKAEVLAAFSAAIKAERTKEAGR